MGEFFSKLDPTWTITFLSQVAAGVSLIAFVPGGQPVGIAILGSAFGQMLPQPTRKQAPKL